MLADPAAGDLLDEAEVDRANLDEWQHANLAEMRQQWAHATASIPALVEAPSKACAWPCEQVWRVARPAGDRHGEAGVGRTAGVRVRDAAEAKGRQLAARPTTPCPLTSTSR